MFLKYLNALRSKKADKLVTSVVCVNQGGQLNQLAFPGMDDIDPVMDPTGSMDEWMHDGCGAK